MNDVNHARRPLFSVVVAAYNSAAFIDRCIRSVVEQTCSDFELVLVDDGSTDETFDICSSYAQTDPRVRVIHQRNGGHTSARNEGLRASVGEYILFLDSDDWLAAGTLESCKDAISAHGADVVIYGIKNSTAATPFSVLVQDGCYEMGGAGSRAWNDLLIAEDGKFVFPRSLSAKCFKREVILDSQLSVPKEILVGEDGAAFIGAMLSARAVSVIAGDGRACYHCLVRPGSVSRSSDPQAFQRVGCLLEYYRGMLCASQIDFSEQFDRYVVEQLYTATLLVMRSGAGNRELNDGLENLLKRTFISKALKDAKFNLKGYKLLVKKCILRGRLWGLVRLLDR